ncbi:hypothetical protein C6P45_004886 [Maudiozyma exigua]|uniref:Thiaminase-2/PQQC domain-containing protein n=1 Tax=Maudiozyma exigua TaxID=34358 RepID=A0A9P7BAU8_MAUEX|nr:hypothetical protein C6P45_004886 [Kazachstania exigua]
MSYTNIKVNSPAPYFNLNKNDGLSKVLIVSGGLKDGQKSMERDIKILTSHKCDTAFCLAHISVGDKSIEVPSDDMSKSMTLGNDFIKLDNVTTEQLSVLQAKIEEGSKLPSLVVVTETLGKEFQRNFSHTEGSMENAELLVIRMNDCKPFVELKAGKVDSIDELKKVTKDINEKFNFKNILIIDTNGDGNKHALFLGKTEQYFVINSTPEVIVNNASSIATAIIANLANCYGIKESVYGAIEFIQNCLLLASDNKTPNYMYNVETPLKHILQDECFEAHELLTEKSVIPHNPTIHNNFFEYLINHDLVKKHWDSYVNHDFVRQIADGTLDLNKFKFFIEQDYSYLVDYGRVHCIAGSKSPKLEDMEEELVIVGRIRNEMRQHEKRLKEIFGVSDDSYFEQIERGPALNNYSRYFNDIAKRGTWQELVAALTPCMMGYGAAAMKYKENVSAEKGGLYDEWIDIYSCANYEDGMKIGSELLNHIN